MARSIDKFDVAEALAEALDDTRVEGLGSVLLGHAEEAGVLVLESWPDGDDQPSVDFLLRITRFRQPGAVI